MSISNAVAVPFKTISASVKLIFPTPSVYAAYPLLTSIFPLLKSIFPPVPIEAIPAAPSVTLMLVYCAWIIPLLTINPIPLYDPALPDTSAP